MEKNQQKSKASEDPNMSLGKSKSQPVPNQSYFGNHENDDYTLPRATLTQMIKDYLPQDQRMSQQSSDLIIQLSMNFLTFLSDSSNNICNNEGKKTITPSHVAKALKDLKMDCYLAKILELGIDEGGEVKLTEKQTKDMISQKLVTKDGKKKKKRGHKDNNNGMTEEEMIAEQQRLFENARNFQYDDDDEQEEEQMQNNAQVEQQQQQLQQQQFQYYTAEEYNQAAQNMQMQQYQYQMMQQQQMMMVASQAQNGNNQMMIATQGHQNGNDHQQFNGNQNLDNNQLYSEYVKQMEKTKSTKEVEQMNFDEDDEQADQ